MSDQKITLTDLEKGIFTVKANLPEACQQLYDNVAGPNITLNDDEFPDFSAAIERSVNTEGLIGHNMLKKKSGEEDFLGEWLASFRYCFTIMAVVLNAFAVGTYLRITLGKSLGNSPGSPYVLEIWPAGHHSHIHDHGNSYAVIKVRTTSCYSSSLVIGLNYTIHSGPSRNDTLLLLR